MLSDSRRDAGHSGPPRVEVVDLDRTHLAGLMAASILRRNLARPRGAALAGRLRGVVAVDVGGMRFAIEFGDDAVRIRVGDCERPRLRVRATLGALLDAALGRGVAVAFLRGRLRMRGNPLLALRLLPLLRADG